MTMQFLIDANLPRSIVMVCRAHGHDAVHVSDVFPPGASDATVAEHARSSRQCLVTRDYDFADVRAYPPADYAGIVVLEIADSATATSIRRLMASFLEQEHLIAQLTSKLAIVEFGRVRLRGEIGA